MKRRKRITAPSRVTASVMALALSQLLLCACQQSDADGPQPAPRQPVALQLTSGIATTVTRAYDATWEKDDQIGVFTVKAGSTNASDITYSGSTADANIPYTATAGATYASGSVASGSYNASNQTYQSFSPSGAPIYLPIDGSNVDVYAYYPYAETGATGQPVTISNDLNTLNVTLETTQTLAGQKQYDLMTAKALSSSSPINIDYASTQLKFEHCLTKVLIKVKAGTGYSSADLANVAISLPSQPTTATLSPLTQALAAGTATASITPYKLVSGDADYSKLGDALYIYRALIMPTTSASGSIVITVGTTSTANYTYSIPRALPAGYETTFTLTLQATGVTVTAAITPWSESSSVPETPIYEAN